MSTQDPIGTLCQLLASGKKLLPIGGSSKPALHTTSAEASAGYELFSMADHAGIVTYDPSEYLITAKSGTTIAELNEALSEQNQYLPFDPLFAEQGATLGGTIASGLSGPCSMLYGTLRDFVMEIELIDGLGRVVRGGGKVVKNAAGFDLPKLMVGSYGRLGVLAEVTLKVLPRPEDRRGLSVRFGTLAEGIQAAQKLLCLPLPIEALQLDGDGGVSIVMSGPKQSLAMVCERASSELSGEVSEFEIQENSLFRADSAKLDSQECLIKVVGDAATVSKIAETESSRLRCLSGNLSRVWLSVDRQSLPELHSGIESSGGQGLVIRRGVDCDADVQGMGLEPIGSANWARLAGKIQRAIDPNCAFPAFAK